MPSEKLLRMCAEVERKACELDELVAQGHAATSYCVMLRTVLGIQVAELEYHDLMERLASTR
jgi:hypothetical protein